MSTQNREVKEFREFSDNATPLFIALCRGDAHVATLLGMTVGVGVALAPRHDGDVYTSLRGL